MKQLALDVRVAQLEKELKQAQDDALKAHARLGEARAEFMTSLDLCGKAAAKALSESQARDTRRVAALKIAEKLYEEASAELEMVMWCVLFLRDLARSCAHVLIALACHAAGATIVWQTSRSTPARSSSLSKPQKGSFAQSIRRDAENVADSPRCHGAGRCSSSARAPRALSLIRKNGTLSAALNAAKNATD